MPVERNILVYASHFEHINRGCMEAIFSHHHHSSFRLTVVRCDDSHHACYLNQCLASADKEFSINLSSACSICVANQSVFDEYARKFRFNLYVTSVPSVSANYVLPADLKELIEYCLRLLVTQNFLLS